MDITIKDEAKDYLADKIIDGGGYIFLVADDGSNKFSDVGGTCTIGNAFKLVFSKSEDADYTVALTNNVGYKLYTSKNELPYLGNGLTLTFANRQLVLKDDSGTLDSAVAKGKAKN